MTINKTFYVCYVHRHIGGLENSLTAFAKVNIVHRHIGGLEKHLSTKANNFMLVL